MSEIQISEKQARRIGLQVVAASWLACFCLFGYRSTFAVLKVPIAREMHWSSANVTSGYSILMMIYALAAYFSSIILQRWGAKWCYLMAAVFGSLGFLLTSYMDGLAEYYLAFGVLGGIGTGMLWLALTLSLRRWFIGVKYARMMGLAFMGGPMAQIVLGLLVKSLIPHFGWRIAARVLAAIVLACLLLAFGLSKKSPEHYGVSPFGDAPNRPLSTLHLWSLKESFSTYPIWGVMLTFLATQTAEFLIWSQAVSYFVEDLGMSLNRAVNLYSTIGFFGIFSMPLMGIVGDRIVHAAGRESKGRRIALIGGSMAAGIACLTLLVAGHSLVLSVFACLLFAVYWSVIPGAVVGYAGSIYGQLSLARIWGLATLFCIGLGPPTGSFLGGAIRDWTGSYRGSICFALGAFVVASILAFTLPLSVRRPEPALELEKKS